MKLRSGKEIEQVEMANNFQDALDHVEINLDSKEPRSSVKIEVFSLQKSIDPRLWLTKFQFLSQIYQWNDEQSLKNVVFYLGDELWPWYKEKCDAKEITDLKTFEENFLRYVNFKGTEFSKQLELDHRKIRQGESLISYLNDVHNLCHAVDPKMSTKTTCYHVLKGLPEWLTHNLLTQEFDKVDVLWEKLKGRISENNIRDQLYGGGGSPTSSRPWEIGHQTERDPRVSWPRDPGNRTRYPGTKLETFVGLIDEKEDP